MKFIETNEKCIHAADDILRDNTGLQNKKTDSQLTPEELAAKNSDAYYQATMDWQRGGKNPDEAYKDRGFRKNSRGYWVF